MIKRSLDEGRIAEVRERNSDIIRSVETRARIGVARAQGALGVVGATGIMGSLSGVPQAGLLRVGRGQVSKPGIPVVTRRVGSGSSFCICTSTR